jgi:hypothetical protein
VGLVKATGAEMGSGWEEAVVEVLGKEVGPAKAVTCLAWRPPGNSKAEDGDGGRRGGLLAVSSEDCGVRLVRV